jgi:hypothetical protein
MFNVCLRNPTGKKLQANIVANDPQGKVAHFSHLKGTCLWQTLLFKPWSLKIAHETPHVTVHE